MNRFTRCCHAALLLAAIVACFAVVFAAVEVGHTMRALRHSYTSE